MEKESILEPDLFTYDNYRIFIRDYLDFQKSHKYGASLRSFSKKAGFSSHSFLTHLIKGERNLSAESIEKMIPALGLSGRQASYFRTLVLYNQSLTAKEKQSYLQELKVFRGDTLFYKVQQAQFDYYSHWYMPVLRELACTKSWNGNYSVLASMLSPAISESEARQGVLTLVSIGLLRKKAGDKFTLQDNVITAEGIPGVIFRSARSEFMLRAIEASETLPKEERHTSYAVIGTTEAKFNDICETLDSVRKKILQSLDESDPVECVYCINLQAFPVSKTTGE
jgi:uncharacterized protein (TIGR02147 family)